MLHNFEGLSINGADDITFEKFMASELDYYTGYEAGRRVIAQQYVGLPYEDLE